MRLHLAATPDPNVNPLVPTWAEVILVAVIFIALVYLFAKFIAPQFEKAFSERRDAIEGGIARAEAAQLEAARTLEQYQHQLADARGEAAQIRENARGPAHRRGSPRAGAGGVGPHRRSRRGAAGQPTRSDRARTAR